MGGSSDSFAKPTWWQFAKDLCYKEFRREYFTYQRRQWRMFWKYESHLFYERMAMGFLVAGIMAFLCNTNVILGLFRLPTEDVNELLKQDTWKQHRNEINERKEQANKILEDSNYIRRKNTDV